MNKTAGFEKFERLTDKSNVLLYMLKEEAATLFKLRDEIKLLRRKNKELKAQNRRLNSRVELMEEKKDIIDTRAGELLGALDDAHLL